jgi:hypothetical protein
MNMVNAMLRFTDIDLHIAVHNDKPFSDADWARYVATINAYTDETHGSWIRFRGLTFTDGAAPNSRQRRLLVATGDRVHDMQYFAGAIISDSSFVRGVVTALQWLRPSGLRCFAPEASDRALSYLGVRPEERKKFFDEAAVLARQVGCRTFIRTTSFAQEAGAQA